MTRVSEKMASVNGEVSGVLRAELSNDGAYLRRLYRADTGKPTRSWCLHTPNHQIAIAVNAATVKRWVRLGFVELEFVSPTDHSPSYGAEYAIIRRCARCQCCGYTLNSDDRCEDCAGVEKGE